MARTTGRPLQVHSGFGDPDIDLLQANPLLLRPVLEDPPLDSVPIVLLHLAYPYFREAWYLAAIWPQVHVDLSLAPAFLGPGSIPPLVEMLSLAPWSKLLYGSDVGDSPSCSVSSRTGHGPGWAKRWAGSWSEASSAPRTRGRPAAPSWPRTRWLSMVGCRRIRRLISPAG